MKGGAHKDKRARATNREKENGWGAPAAAGSKHPTRSRESGGSSAHSRGPSPARYSQDAASSGSPPRLIISPSSPRVGARGRRANRVLSVQSLLRESGSRLATNMHPQPPYSDHDTLDTLDSSECTSLSSSIADSSGLLEATATSRPPLSQLVTYPGNRNGVVANTQRADSTSSTKSQTYVYEQGQENGVLKQLNILRRNMDTVSCSNNALLAQLELERHRVANLQTQGDSLQSQYSVAEETRAVTNKVLNDLVAQTLTLGQEKKEALARLEQKQAEVDALEAERADVESKVQEQYTTPLQIAEDRQHFLERELQSLQEQLENGEGLQQTMETRIVCYKAEADIAQEQYLGVAAQMSRARFDLDSERGKVQDLGERLVDAQVRADQLALEFDRAQAQADLLADENQSMVERFDAQTALLAQMQAAMAEQAASSATLLEELKAAQSSLSALQVQAGSATQQGESRPRGRVRKTLGILFKTGVTLAAGAALQQLGSEAFMTRRDVKATVDGDKDVEFGEDSVGEEEGVELVREI